MKIINVGLIGFGVSGEYFHAPFITTLPGWSLKSVVSSRGEKILQRYPHVRILNNSAELMTDPEIDVVIITTPNITHFPLAREALLANKHVVVEKPFVLNLAEGKELSLLANAQRKILTVYQNRRWDNSFLTLKKLMRNNILGPLLEVEIHFDRYRPFIHLEKWREHDLPGSGLLYDLGSHLLDQALQLFGVPQKYCINVGIQRRDGVNDDYFHILFQYDRLRVILHAGSVVAASPAHYVAHGELGSFVKWELDPQEAQLRRGMLPSQPEFGWDGSLAELTLVDKNNPQQLIKMSCSQERGDYATFYRQLYRAIIEGEQPPVLMNEALELIRWIELCKSFSEKTTGA